RPRPADPALQRRLQPNELWLDRNSITRLDHEPGRPRSDFELQAARLAEVFKASNALGSGSLRGNIDAPRTGVLSPLQRPVAIDCKINDSPLPHRTHHLETGRFERGAGRFGSGGQ